jgi:type IV pilus assembly protein PilY1
VTTSISRLQDGKNRNLWLYFGSGRYFFRDNAAMDDREGERALYGIKEPCFNTLTTPGNVLDKTCTAAISGTVVDQTSAISTLVSTDPGWKITLDAATTSSGAERVVTDTVALTNGTVFFTSFKPTLDLCGYGGNSFLWATKYDTGGQGATSAMTGKALIQLSTGEFKEVDLSAAFTDKLNRRMATPMTGKPPSDAPPIISSSQNKPVKKILHIQER